MKKIILTGLLGLILAACGKDPESELLSGEMTPITQEATVAGSRDAQQTRARQDGSFSENSKIGLFVRYADGTQISSLYDNVLSLYNGTSWLYYINGVYNGLALSGFKSWGNIALYGYHPYDDAVTDLSNIPFRIATTTTPGYAEAYEEEVVVDYMVSEAKYKDMANDPNYLSVEFHHIMTGIDFKLRRLNPGPALMVSGATFEISGGQSFGIAGSYTGKGLNNIAYPGDNINTISESATTINVTYTSSDKIIKYSSAGIDVQSTLLIMPELRNTTGVGGTDDATVTITLYFDDTDGNPFVFEEISGGDPTISFKLSDILNQSNDNGLLAGYVYAIEASIGTYVKFSGAPKIVYQPLVDAGDPEYVEI